jgi:hypothetical protein
MLAGGGDHRCRLDQLVGGMDAPARRRYRAEVAVNEITSCGDEITSCG